MIDQSQVEAWFTTIYESAGIQLALDDDQQCRLRTAAGVVTGLAFDFEADKLTVTCALLELATWSAGERTQLVRKAMKANLLTAETGGTTLAYLADNHKLVQIFEVALTELNGSRLEVLLNNLPALAEKLKTDFQKINEGGTETPALVGDDPPLWNVMNRMV